MQKPSYFSYLIYLSLFIIQFSRAHQNNKSLLDKGSITSSQSIEKDQSQTMAPQYINGVRVINQKEYNIHKILQEKIRDHFTGDVKINDYTKQKNNILFHQKGKTLSDYSDPSRSENVKALSVSLFLVLGLLGLC